VTEIGSLRERTRPSHLRPDFQVLPWSCR
jgi:hypothetical protein